MVYYTHRQWQALDENLQWWMGHRCAVDGGPGVDIAVNRASKPEDGCPMLLVKKRNGKWMLVRGKKIPNISRKSTSSLLILKCPVCMFPQRTFQ